MSRPNGEASSDTAMENAVAWFVRLDAGPLDEAGRGAFEAWLSADPAHQAAYARVEGLWRELDDVPASGTVRLRGIDGMAAKDVEPAPAARPSRRGFWRPAVAPAARPSRRGFWRPAVAAAAAAVLLVLALGTDIPMTLRADAISAVGELRTVPLPDGSIALLNTDSAIAVDFTARERRIRLLRGEAAFTAARNPERPFRVEADGGVTTALGTVFVVRRRAERATVTVIESKVAVTYPGGDDPARTATLSPGQRVSYASATGLGPVEPVDPRTAAAWRRGKLIFVDRPLGEVIDELNRYHAGHIGFLDDALRSRRVSGVFETGEPVAVVNTLENSLGLDSTRLTDLLILLHR